MSEMPPAESGTSGLSHHEEPPPSPTAHRLWIGLLVGGTAVLVLLVILQAFFI
ncbi:DUF6480 family protein [Allokutzneria albata]|uniref:Uncharacterized protein n=1 Tax=Allokutzneria albata TaxID=211114 RepID=A0A1G9UH50_ALLAB|nr:DUF6480 family protein [Allokutzneria albata]SDM59251.1 hypothetical protein SAMN04489726_2409 [Allokutzneria albata]